MNTNFPLFGAVHLSILAAIPALAAALAWLARRRPGTRFALGALLLANETIWWIWRALHEGPLFPQHLPLQLSDFTLWLTILAAFTLWRWPYEVAYYAGMTSAALACITPDLWTPFPSYPSIYFFVEHGGAVVTVLALTWSGLARPRAGSILRAMIALNGYAAAVGTFNWIFSTNYMYLSRKPANPSPLDWFGPWPLYLLPAEALAAAVFWLLWLPFRRATVPESTPSHERSKSD